MNIVLDTNAFLVIFPENSSYHSIYHALFQNKFNLLLSHEILLEYEEQFSIRYSQSTTKGFIEGLLENKNFIRCEPSFYFNIIDKDPDDNKFVDCAVAGNADYIVTNDKHFQVLKEIEFPKINCITLQEFKRLLKL